VACVIVHESSRVSATAHGDSVAEYIVNGEVQRSLPEPRDNLRQYCFAED